MKLNFAMFRIKLNKSVYIISVLYTVLLWNCKNTGHSSDLRINNDSLFNRLIIIDLDSLEEKDLVTYPVRLEYLRKIEVGGSVFEVADKWPDRDCEIRDSSGMSDGSCKTDLCRG